MAVGTCWNRSQLVLTAYLRSFSLIGLQMGSPSRLTITAAVLLKKIVGGSALIPTTVFGTMLLLSTFTRMRSSAITRSSFGKALVICATISATRSLASSLKLASVIFRFWKLTRRSSSATLVSASSLIEPSTGFSAPLARSDTAL